MFRNRLKLLAPKLWTWVRVSLGFGLLLWASAFIFPPIPKQLSYSTLVTDASGEVLHAFLSADDKWRMFVELDEITPQLEAAFVEKEDAYFYYHFGINPIALLRALVQNTVSGKRLSGASTITMQVIRLANPSPRTYLNKIRELVQAIQLELHYSKREILQIYLNLVPYGSNIEGIKSASYLYFQKSPDRLSVAEIVTLAIIPNRPTSLQLGRYNSRIQQARNEWLKRFEAKGVFSSQQVQYAQQEPLTATRHAPPTKAPHLAIRLHQASDNQPIIQSTIRFTVQAKAEQLVENYVNSLQSMGIHNAAAYVLDNRTKEVIAYVGSANFRNQFDGGQVDGVQAVRSPGSALKPFLYALAFEQGWLTPKYKLLDVPTSLSGFEPENYDKTYRGSVTAHSALANSLNIPAVNMLQQVGTATFIERLKQANLSTIKKQEKDLGLSMILGGCGVTLEELTTLYAAFANEGLFQSYRSTATPANTTPFQLFDSGVVSQITDILSTIQRPDLPNNFDYTYRLPKIAWKTGTSYGRRDAWSIGYNPNYTIGVWVGNFSGLGVPELSGAEIATPLLFALFNSIDYAGRPAWFKRPSTVQVRAVCAETGKLPSSFCQDLVLDTYLVNKSHHQPCDHLKSYFVNLTETLHYCTYCLPTEGVKEKLYLNRPPALWHYLASKGDASGRVPPHNPQCSRIGLENGYKPIISSPTDGSEYFIDTTDPQKLALQCQPANDVQDVYWYVDGVLINKVNASETLFWLPTYGQHTIDCVDDRGRKSSIKITVKLL